MRRQLPLMVCILALVSGCASEDSAVSQATDTGTDSATGREIEALLALYEKSVNEAEYELITRALGTTGRRFVC